MILLSWKHLGDVYFNKGQYERALEYYERGVILVERDENNSDPKLKDRLYKKVDDLRKKVSMRN